MRAELLNRWRRIRASYWLIPALMALAAVGMVAAAHQVDEAVAAGRLHLGLLVYRGGPAGARAILSTIAASMITVAGVAFSTMMVALALASSEFGPRLLENFIRDRGNQVVLGTFICTFLYGVLALRTVRSGPGPDFVPRFTVTLGILLSVASVGLFIYFIHHVIRLIQAPRVVARVGSNLDTWVRRLFPAPDGESDPSASPAAPKRESAAVAPIRNADGDVLAPAGPGDPTPKWCSEGAGGRLRGPVSRSVESRRSGYLQTLDHERLVSLADEHDLLIVLSVYAGDFVLAGDELVRVHCQRNPQGGVEDRLVGAFVLGDQRTPAQDPEFVVQQLAELATRALSAGINDPYTAVNCIDRLGAALARVARRPRPPERLRGPDGRVRLLLDPITFAELTCAALDPIREYGRSHSTVLHRLLDVLESLARIVRRPEDLDELRWHVDRVVSAAREGLLEETAREAIVGRYEEVSQALDARRDEIAA